MISGQEEIAVQKNSIEKLDLVLKELMAEKNPTALASILNRAGSMLKEQGSMEQKAQNALKEAASLFEKRLVLKEEKRKKRRTGRFGMFNIGIDFGSTYTTVSATGTKRKNWKP